MSEECYYFTLLKNLATNPREYDKSEPEPERTLGIWIVPILWKPNNSIPSAVKNGMSQRTCAPRNNSVEPRSGALGVLRSFCFCFCLLTTLPLISSPLDVALLLLLPYGSKVFTKFGL